MKEKMSRPDYSKYKNKLKKIIKEIRIIKMEIILPN